MEASLPLAHKEEEDDKDVEVRCHARVSAGRTPSERSLHTCTLQTIEGCRVVYLYGGRSKSGSALDDIHVLDLEANFWSSPKPKSEKPAGRYGHCAVSHGEFLYVVTTIRGELQWNVHLWLLHK